MADSDLLAAWRKYSASQDHADQVLHDQLLAAQLQAGHGAPPPPRPQPGMQHVQPMRDHSNIDPSISGGPPTAGMIPAPPQPPQSQQSAQSPDQMMQDQGSETRKMYGKRELSTSKRAAQNRAAQRAFRQRKEGYIRKLEEQVKEYEIMSENYKALQAENYQLREYIIGLQSRLIDTQSDVPELPANIDLTQTHPDPSVTAAQAAAVAVGQAAGQPEQLNALNRIAVAGLGVRKHQHEEAAFLGNTNFAKRLRSEMVGDESGDPSGVGKIEGAPLPSLPS
ncbi:hypothetical protein LOZ53_001804 [Ophidiomyces ophidiicola]|nr:hypothetical protein LOZ54_006480 [Ophidiomyces ophidiicola]KAI1980333.1 hypothetical protein LOZ55_001483 [Ophidiomyces ophidiicola]KAI1987926.1 hypothetical protein LOZ51_005690 [Ophidiomyces ophidiicola]KAI1994677.1 hypothetical protein LOZ53_001804 [Ophidiomyces ophidiicola]